LGLIELIRTAGRVACRLLQERKMMWEQREEAAESQVFWLYLVASEEIKGEMEVSLGEE